MIRQDSPFSPLAAGADLSSYPSEDKALRSRLAAVYGVAPDEVWATRGATHGLELILRRAKLHGYEAVAAPKNDITERLCEIYGLERRDNFGKGCGALIVARPDPWADEPVSLEQIRRLAVEIFPAWLIVDESLIEFTEVESAAVTARTEANICVLRSLSYLYGLSGARVGAVIAGYKLIHRLESLTEPHPLPGPSLAAARAALDPSRILVALERIQQVQAERLAIAAALNGSDLIEGVVGGCGPAVALTPKSPKAFEADLNRLGLSHQRHKDRFLIALGAAGVAARLSTLTGEAAAARPHRIGEVVRDTKETKISVRVDLDATGPVKASTGVGFFDHMLEQIGTHGGIGLTVGCSGDLHIDPHHAIEDVMLALGQALKIALGDRKGLSRFGFLLPMDETEAQVAVDLGGRPYCLFKGAFSGSHIGEYPTEMTEHAFRSLAETLGANIHVTVEGGNDHHKTEACFKAFGRALRQAVRVEGDALPTTKGFLA